MDHDFTPGELVDPDDPIWTEIEDETGEVVDPVEWLLQTDSLAKALELARFYCGDELDGLTGSGNQEMDVMCWTILRLARQVVQA